MTTHPSTKNAHPGAPDMLAPHCTHQEVEVACQEAAVKQAEEMALRDKAVDLVVSIEDKQ